MHRKHISVIIVAGGCGSRLGLDKPKQYLPLCGKPIILYSLEKFQSCEMIDEIITVIPDGTEMFFNEKILCGESFEKMTHIVAGGNERQQSVYNGMKRVAKETDIVLIHDAARPLVRASDIRKIINETFSYHSCSLGVLAKDTIKIVGNDGFVTGSLNRSELYYIQTPQAFAYEIIMAAHDRAIEESFKGTDDATLVENMGIKTKIVIGSYDNIKITTSEDLIIADALLRNMKEGKK